MAGRQYGLVVYGASGYTGRESVAHLGRRASQIGLSWAIAGRSRQKLEEVAAASPGPPPGIIVAEGTERKTLSTLAQSGEVLISLVGPHAPLGDELLAECIAAGTDYADLCGENDVIVRRLERLHEPARAAGVKLIPACGFESVPFDLGVLGLDSAFREVDGSRLREAEAEARFIFHRSPLRYGHGTSGGTLATVARLIEFGDLTDSRSFARVAEPVEIAQPIGLEARRSRDGEWLGPLMPTPFLNPAVMALSSQRLEEGPGGYAPGFRYRESLNLSASLGSSLLGKLAAKGSSALARRLDAMSRRQQTPSDRFILAALDALAPAAGLGPRRSALDSIDYEIELRASSSSGLHGKGKVHGKGHPGYRSAANILAETGIGLARDETLPERYGVQTPASALGWGFADSLASAGLHFEIDVGDAVQA